MALLAFWPAPKDADTSVIRVLRSPSKEGPYTQISQIEATDYYGNWVTHYLDDEPEGSSEMWYRAIYFKHDAVGNLQAIKASKAEIGYAPFQVTPQMVIDQMQGVPLNAVDAKHINRQISWTIGHLESFLEQRLRPISVTNELLRKNDWKKVLGDRKGQTIRLFHFPVKKDSVSFSYRVRGRKSNTPEPLDGLDIMLENHNEATGFNRGGVTVWPEHIAISSIISSVSRIPASTVSGGIRILASYTHGWDPWPADLEQVVTQWVAAEMMEVGANAENPGITSRGVDGYMETYGASATTTQFSALRLHYEEQSKKLLRPYKKVLMA